MAEAKRRYLVPGYMFTGSVREGELWTYIHIHLCVVSWEDSESQSQDVCLVSTYVVCERLSVMHEPAGVVEILVQILQFTPIL